MAKIPPSGRALAKLLDEGGDLAERLRAAVHRSQLWRYAHGRRRPSLDTAAVIERASDGRVAANGWTTKKAA